MGEQISVSTHLFFVSVIFHWSQWNQHKRFFFCICFTISTIPNVEKLRIICSNFGVLLWNWPYWGYDSCLEILKKKLREFYIDQYERHEYLYLSKKTRSSCDWITATLPICFIRSHTNILSICDICYGCPKQTMLNDQVNKRFSFLFSLRSLRHGIFEFCNVQNIKQKQLNSICF